jgi:hypothetical protein
MKVAALGLIALALVVGVVPQFTDCASQGRNLTTTTGMIIPMKCHWTAMAEAALGIALGALGLVMLRTRMEETKRKLNMLGVVLGALVALVPTYIIGVCANASMICNSLMKPTLVMSGLLIMGICAVSLVNVVRTSNRAGMAS